MDALAILDSRPSDGIVNLMVNSSPERLDKVFSALSDPTRRAILERLARSEATVTELAAPFEMSLPAISKHLRILEHAGLIAREREGRIHHMRLAAAAMKDAAEWLGHYRRFWDEQFDNLAAFLDSPSEEKLDGATNETAWP
jgi:DNA-binding transcriptional ArsR family regulator